MADNTLVTFVGNPNHEFTHITGEDGEEYTFRSGVAVPKDEVPASVLKLVESKDFAGATFVIGGEQKTENALEKQAEGDEKAKE